MTPRVKQHISRLVKEYSRNGGTEALIGFVAETTGMLAACQDLLQGIDAKDGESRGWLSSECDANNVALHSFLKEVSGIVVLFHPGQDVDAHYTTLGVPSGAGSEEIKKAYRRLSLRYHPDTASSEELNYPEKFLKITEAYHSLLAVGRDGAKDDQINPDAPTNTWRRKKKRTVSSEQRRKVFAWALGLLIVLVTVSIVASINYKKRAMIAGLQENKSAVVVPVTVPAVEQHPGETEKSSKEENVAKATPLESEMLPDSNIEASAEKQPAEKAEAKKRDMVSAGNSTDSIKQSEEEREALLTDEVESEETVSIQPVPLKKEQNLSSALIATEIEAEVGIEAVVEVEVEVEAVVEVETVTENEGESYTSVIPVETKEQDVQLPEGKPLEVDLEKVTDTNNEIVQETDLRSRIDIFLADYIEAYKQRNLILFSRLFEADALENGEPFAAMLQTYMELFAATSDLILQLDILSWQMSDNGVDVRGRFKAHLQYKNSREVSGSGPIRFLLKDNNGDFRVIELEYEFNVE